MAEGNRRIILLRCLGKDYNRRTLVIFLAKDFNK